MMTDHFEHKDPFGDKMGMWVFLFSELLLFGGLFLIYAVYRSMHFEAFAIGSSELNVYLGTFNTFVLLTSSLTMALAIAGLQKGDRGGASRNLLVTLALGLVFLVVKYFEWSAKIHHGIYPGSEWMIQNYPGAQSLFFGIYFTVTGLHGLHIIIGMSVIAVMWFLINQHPEKDYKVALENTGLYWHLVDIIWIYLFPLFYLVD